MADVDNLQIHIEANAQEASQKLNQLADAFSKIGRALSGASGLGTLSKQLQALATASESAKNVGTNIQGIVNGLSQLKDVDSSKALAGVAEKISAINQSLSAVDDGAVSKLSSITGSIKQLQYASEVDFSKNTISQLKEISKYGRLKLSDSFVNQLERLSHLKDAQIPEGFVKSIRSFSKLSEAKIPSSFVNQIEKLGSINLNGKISQEFVDSLKSLSNIKKINITPSSVESLERLSQIKGLGKVKLSYDFIEQLSRLSDAMNRMDGNAFGKIYIMADALKAFSQGNFKMPSIKNFTEQIERLTSIVSNIPTDAYGKMYMIADGLRQFGTVGKASIASTLSQLDKLPELIQRLDDVDFSKFASQIKTLSEALKPLSEQMRNIADGMKGLDFKIPKSALRGTSTKQEKSSSSAKDSGEKEIKAQAEAVKDILQNLRDNDFSVQLSKFSATGMESLKSSLSGLQKEFGGLGKASKVAMKAIDVGLSSLENAHPAIKAISVALKVLVVTLNGVGKAFGIFKGKIQEISNSVKEIPVKALSGLVSQIKKLSSSVAGFSGKTLTNFGKSVLGKFVSPIVNAYQKLSKWQTTLAHVIVYRVASQAINMVTQALKEGTDNLYQYSKMMGTDFAQSMDSIATSAQYLKNSFGAMAAPLINALAPAIDFLIDKFVALLNIIGKVMAVLTGKSVFTQAKKQAKDYADAAGGAASATKKFLLGIDEINKIDDAGGGGGGGGADFSDMFEEVEIGDEYDWARQMREAIENGDWMGAGKILADKLNEVVDSFDAYEWGKKIGEKINNGIEFAYGFLTNFDFENLGKKLADAIYGITDGINWDLLGRTIAQGYNALFDFVYGFATNLPWNTIGHRIAELVNGFVDELNATRAAEAISEFFVGIFDLINSAITGIEWTSIGAKIAELLNNIDWYGIVLGSLSVIKNALNSLRDAINGFLYGDGESGGFNFVDTALKFKNAFFEAWNGIDWEGLGTSIGDLIKGALSFVSTALSGDDKWWTNIEENFRKIGQDIGNFLINLDWPGIFHGLSQALANGIIAAISMTIGFMDTVGPELEEIAVSLADNLKQLVERLPAEDLGESLNRFIENALDAAIAFMDRLTENGGLEEIKNKLIAFFNQIDWDSIGEKVGELLGSVFSAKLEIKETLINVGFQIVSGIWEGVKSAWDEIGFIGLFKFLMQSFYESVLGFFGIHSPSTLFREGVGYNIVAGLLEGITEKWEDIITFFSTAFDGILPTIEKAWDAVKTTTSNILGGVWNFITGGWKKNTKDTDNELKKYDTTVDKNLKDVSKTTEEKFKSIGTTIETTWETAKTNTETQWGQVRTNLGTVMDGINTDASTKMGAVATTVRNQTEEAKKNAETNFSSLKTSLDGIGQDIAKNTDKNFGDVKNNAIKKVSETAKEGPEEFKKFNTELGNILSDTNKVTSSGLDEVKKTVGSKLDETNTTAKEKSGTIKSTFESAWENIKTSASSAWDSIKNTISNKISGIVTSAKQWGSDIMSNFSSGMSKNVSSVQTAATSAANSVSRLLHHSHPDEGPLKDDYTFMPDMMKMFAKGIYSNIPNVESAVTDVASMIDRTISSSFPEDMSVPVHVETDYSMARDNAKVSMENSERERTVMMDKHVQYDMSDKMYKGMQEGNGNLVNVMYAAAQQIVNAINENSGDIYLDGNRISRQTTSMQNRHNRMYGKTLQNT